MTGPPVQAVSELDGTLLCGGVEYIRLEAEAGKASLSFVLGTDAGAAPRVRIARVK